jgi:hypothetical protein
VFLRIIKNKNQGFSISRFHSNKRFKLLKKQDNLLFLNSKRKHENTDPSLSWISTYNLCTIIITRFFKWLHDPHITAKQRPKPSCVEIPALRRREQSIYKPTDLRTQENDLLFLKYCTSKKDKAIMLYPETVHADPMNY